MRSVFTMAFVGLGLLGTAASAQPGGASPDIEGLWGSTMGQLEFDVTDRRDNQGRLIARDVVAPYSRQNNSRVKGQLSGRVLTGYWTEPSSSVQCRTARDGTRYWGRVSFTFDAQGETFDGRWGYCEEAPERGWSGQREGPSRTAASGGQGYAAGGTPAGGGPLPAQAAASAAPARGGGCGPSAAPQQQSAGRSILGALGRAAAGAVLDRGLSRMGVPYAYGLRSTVYSGLLDSIACLLQPRERQQAVQATDQAVSRGVGATREWTSTDRPGVRGSSTVTAQNTRADGALCRDVTDIVIVNGEETRAQKRMCRAPGASGFTLAT